MKQDLVDNLIAKNPQVFKELKYIECSDGWNDLLNVLCSVIENEIKNKIPIELKDQIVAQQIKSKYGGLRVYLSQETPFISGAIALAEELSYNICELCGAPGARHTINTWVSTLCDVHYKEESNSK